MKFPRLKVSERRGVSFLEFSHKSMAATTFDIQITLLDDSDSFRHVQSLDQDQRNSLGSALFATVPVIFSLKSSAAETLDGIDRKVKAACEDFASRSKELDARSTKDQDHFRQDMDRLLKTIQALAEKSKASEDLFQKNALGILQSLEKNTQTLAVSSNAKGKKQEETLQETLQKELQTFTAMNDSLRLIIRDTAKITGQQFADTLVRLDKKDEHCDHGVGILIESKSGKTAVPSAALAALEKKLMDNAQVHAAILFVQSRVATISVPMTMRFLRGGALGSSKILIVLQEQENLDGLVNVTKLLLRILMEREDIVAEQARLQRNLGEVKEKDQGSEMSAEHEAAIQTLQIRVREANRQLSDNQQRLQDALGSISSVLALVEEAARSARLADEHVTKVRATMDKMRKSLQQASAMAGIGSSVPAPTAEQRKTKPTNARKRKADQQEVESTQAPTPLFPPVGQDMEEEQALPESDGWETESQPKPKPKPKLPVGSKPTASDILRGTAKRT